jgi:phosphohistidine phosphatase
MHRLMLLRHAKSDWSQAGLPDHDRQLSKRGRETAPKVGAYMARHALRPDRVLCSTARRTRATWDLVIGELDYTPAVTYERRLYNASADGLFEVVRQVDDQFRAVLVIGHNPGLHDFAQDLIASGDLDRREQLREKLPTAGLVVIDFTLDGWATLHPHAGRLDHFVAPRSLDAVTE